MFSGGKNLSKLAVYSVNRRDNSRVGDVNNVWRCSYDWAVFLVEFWVSFMSYSVPYKPKTPDRANLGKPWTRYLSQALSEGVEK